MITILLQKILEQVKFLKTNIENLPQGIDIYSTTPTKIGKWIDNRDVYRIVFPVTESTAFNLSTSWGSSSTNLTNFELPENCYEIIYGNVIRHASLGPINYCIWGVYEDEETHKKYIKLCSIKTDPINAGSSIIIDYIPAIENP